MFDEENQGLIYWFGINHMIVVQDQDEIARDGGDFIEQGYQNRFGWRWLRGLKRSQRPRSNIYNNCLQSRHEVGQKAGDLVIPFIQ